MGKIRETGRRIGYGVAVFTDWLLIVLGILLVLISLKSIDVRVAKYVVICGGLLLSGLGFWYRWRRLKRKA